MKWGTIIDFKKKCIKISSIEKKFIRYLSTQKEKKKGKKKDKKERKKRQRCVCVCEREREREISRDV